MAKLSFVKIYGGKFQHAKWIISHFPKDYAKLYYIETCLGGGNIPLQAPQAFREFLSDLHYPTYCMYVALQNGDLYNSVKFLTYTEDTFKHFRDVFKPTDVLGHAVQQYVLHRMSRGGMKKDFAWSDRLRGGQPGDLNAWENAVANLPAIQRRFQNAVIMNEDVFSLLKRWGDRPDVFFYIDPPYLLETRTSKSVYELEFTYEHHEQLCDSLLACKARWLLSGYESELYERKLGKPFATKVATLSSSQAKIKAKKTEALWRNYG